MRTPHQQPGIDTTNRCPICKRPLSAAALKERAPHPFCSDRCKLIDLGRWLDGKYQIPVTMNGDENDTRDVEPC